MVKINKLGGELIWLEEEELHYTKRHHKCSTKKHSTRKKHDSKKHLKVEVKVHHKY